MTFIWGATHRLKVAVLKFNTRGNYAKNILNKQKDKKNNYCIENALIIRKFTVILGPKNVAQRIR
jgi:hypothetical protein